MTDYTILFCFIWAITCAFLAARKNRNEALGVIAGFFLGIIAVIYYAVVKPKKVTKKGKK